MKRVRVLVLAGAAMVPLMILTACTSTSGTRNADLPLNSACALGFNNDRPCSY